MAVVVVVVIVVVVVVAAVAVKKDLCPKRWVELIKILLN